MKCAFKNWMNTKVDNWLFALACGLLVMVAVSAKLTTDRVLALTDGALQVLQMPSPPAAPGADRLAP
jgi:hypothetical protein